MIFWKIFAPDDLGHFPTGPVHNHSPPRKQDSPSRHRKRERRTAACEAQDDDNTNVAVTEDLTSIATEEVASLCTKY